MIFWFFGYPGIGKDYLAEKLSELVSIPHINADDFLTKIDKKKLIDGTFTKKDRIKKLKRIISHIKKILRKYPHLTAADSLPDNLSRELLLKTFGSNITFIHVSAPTAIHKKRLKERQGHFFTVEMLDSWIKRHWEEIKIQYISLRNVPIKSQKLEKKLLKIYKKVLDGITP